jgi:hypothetical protein
MVSVVNARPISNYVLVLLVRNWYHGPVLNCTWDDVEAASAMRKLASPLKEREKLHSYLKLREEYRIADKHPADPIPNHPLSSPHHIAHAR